MGLVTPVVLDVLSHAAVRARNSGVLLASCSDSALLQGLRALEGRSVEIRTSQVFPYIYSTHDGSHFPPSRLTEVTMIYCDDCCLNTARSSFIESNQKQLVETIHPQQCLKCPHCNLQHAKFLLSLASSWLKFSPGMSHLESSSQLHDHRQVVSTSD